jgi:hypothetical protein
MSPTRRLVRALHPAFIRLVPLIAVALLSTGCNASNDDDGLPTAPSPPPTSSGAPQLTGISADPGGAGLQHATEFSFQPIGEPGTSPTFAWTFGEGGSSNAGADVRYVYAQAGTFTVRLEARNQAGSSAVTRNVDVRSLAGAWSGTVSGHTTVPPGQPQPIRSFELALNETPMRTLGPVSGSWLDNAGCRQQTMLAQVGHPREVMISLEGLFCNNTDFTLTGALDASGNVIEGRCANGGPDCTFRMTRR